jgi:hypothetical protein
MYRELVGDGVPGPEATDHLLDRWQETLDDPDEGPEFWFALAATQWRTGRLEPRVRDSALELIRSGEGLDGWPSPAQRRARARVLEKLEAQLTSPQRAPVRIRPQLRTTMPLVPGDAVTFRLTDGRLTLLRVVHCEGDDDPTVEVADWLGDVPPANPAGLPFRVLEEAQLPFHARTDLMILVQFRKGEYPVERIDVVARGLTIDRLSPYPAKMVRWDDLDDTLRELFASG